MGQSVPSARGGWWHKTGRSCWYTRAVGGPQQAGEMCCQKTHKTKQGEVQSPTPERSSPSHHQLILGTTSGKGGTAWHTRTWKLWWNQIWTWQRRLMHGCIRKNVTSRQVGCLSLCSAQTRLHLEYLVQFWSSQYVKDMDILKSVQQRPQGWWRDWTISPTREGWELGLNSLEERRLRGKSSMHTSRWRGGYRGDRARLFPLVPSERTKGTN